MRIALLAHVRQPIRQPFLGGMEAHGWYLAEGLMARGHEVVLFAAGDSDPHFTIDPVLPVHYEAVFPWAEHRGKPELSAHVDRGYAEACERIARGGFDVVHNNSLHRFPLEQRRTAVTPTVTSLHVPPYDALHHFVRVSPSPSHRLTVTSQSQLKAWWPEGAPVEASVLHNAIDPAAWPFVEQGNGEGVWCGRITPNKGPHWAILAAREAVIALTLFGAIEDRDYWAAEVEPLLDQVYSLPLYSQADLVSVAGNKRGWAIKGGNPGRFGNMREPVPCWSLFTEARVTHDGHLSACCFDHDGRFHMGDLNEIPFMDAWTSEKFQNLRRAHLSGDVRETVCKACVSYG